MQQILSPCFFLNLEKLGQSSHRAILVEDLANDGRRIESGQAGQINGGFGVSSSPQNAAGFALQRKNVAWLHQLTRERVSTGQKLNGGCAVP